MIIDKHEQTGTNEQFDLKPGDNRWWLSIRTLVLLGMFGIGAFTLIRAVVKAR